MKKIHLLITEPIYIHLEIIVKIKNPSLRDTLLFLNGFTPCLSAVACW